MSPSRFALLCGLPVAIALPAAGHASGVEHVIDNADVETPGLCHLESFAVHNARGRGLLAAAPACTRTRWPWLEMGGFVTYARAPGERATTIGLAPKLKLREAKDGPGVALKATIGYGTASRRIESATVLAPVTVHASDRLDINVNVGCQWLRGSGASAFAGIQAERTFAKHFEIMGEVFGRADGRPGGQVGFRWTTAHDRIDLDLAYGRYVDGIAPHAVTLGVALRFGTAA